MSELLNRIDNNFEGQFLHQGYIIGTVENKGILDGIRAKIMGLINVLINSDIGNLEQIHDFVTKDKVNEIRVSIYKELNSRKDFLEEFYSLAKDHIERIVGNELAAQQKVNFSILMPQDDSSQLKLHSDTMSGQSEYEVVLWVPFVDVKESNSMYIMDFDTTHEMFSSLSNYHVKGMDALYNDYKNKAKFLELQYGQFLLFSPTLFHGSIVNRTSITRVSMNARFKGLFTPYYSGDETEKKLGSFYSPLKVRPATMVGLRHKEPNFE